MPGQEQGEQSALRQPIPLYIGLIGTAIVVYVFAVVYAHVDDTTGSGWCATFGAALELAGVLLVASPELRPIVEKVGWWVAARVRTWPLRFRNFLRRLVGKGDITVHAGTGVVSLEGGIGTEVAGAYESPPGNDAPQEEKVEYLLRVAARTQELIHLIENDLRKAIEQVRGEIQRTALDRADGGRRRATGTVGAADAFPGGWLHRARPDVLYPANIT